MQVMRRFTLHTLIAAGVLVLVHLTTFIMTVILLLSVENSITDLNSAGMLGLGIPFIVHAARYRNRRAITYRCNAWEGREEMCA